MICCEPSHVSETKAVHSRCPFYEHLSPGLDTCYSDPAQQIISAGEGLDDTSDLSVDDLSDVGYVVNA